MSVWLNDDKARARLTDPLTSHQAADGTTGTREHSWLLIERALAANLRLGSKELGKPEPDGSPVFECDWCGDQWNEGSV